jgi:hypothetical protein
MTAVTRDRGSGEVQTDADDSTTMRSMGGAVVTADMETVERRLAGVITEARILRDDGGLEAHEAVALEEIYDWLDVHLPCPPFSSSDWPRDAVSWFKDDAGEAIGRIWDIISILREHSVPVRILRSRMPGKILYEDKYQVVALEWKRT